MTNADKIRNMNDEELNEFIQTILDMFDNCCSRNGIISWLKSETDE